jgi:hypothetical protein
MSAGREVVLPTNCRPDDRILLFLALARALRNSFTAPNREVVMDKSSEINLSESNGDLSNASGGREYAKTVPTSAKNVELDLMLEELAEIIEAEGCVLIP